MEQCTHVWLANNGDGGPPRFNIRMVGDVEPVMHALCPHCRSRTFFTEKGWYSMAEAQDASTA